MAAEPKETEDLVLAESMDLSNPAVAVVAAKRQADIQAAVWMAKKYPVAIQEVKKRLTAVCTRFDFAAIARYSYPRGGKPVKGGTIKLARAIANEMEHVSSGIEIVERRERAIRIAAFAWDMQRNRRHSIEDDFDLKKEESLWENGKRAGSRWVYLGQDERGIRELVSRRGSLILRNAIFAVLPAGLEQECLALVYATLANGVNSDPDGYRRWLASEFDKREITVADLAVFLGCELAEADVEQLVSLGDVLNGLENGHKWKEYTRRAAAGAGEPAPAAGEKPHAAVDKAPPEDASNTVAAFKAAQAEWAPGSVEGWQRQHPKGGPKCTGPGCAACGWADAQPHAFQPAKPGGRSCKYCSMHHGYHLTRWPDAARSGAKS
jgi:hypothetical protein